MIDTMKHFSSSSGAFAASDMMMDDAGSDAESTDSTINTRRWNKRRHPSSCYDYQQEGGESGNNSGSHCNGNDNRSDTNGRFSNSSSFTTRQANPFSLTTTTTSSSTSTKPFSFNTESAAPIFTTSSTATTTTTTPSIQIQEDDTGICVSIHLPNARDIQIQIQNNCQLQVSGTSVTMQTKRHKFVHQFFVPYSNLMMMNHASANYYANHQQLVLYAPKRCVAEENTTIHQEFF
mmetsp:Transcript_12562/g.36558  ORF Transcript_12562/g.36558 Transcript_12562/m.36558 type:complete len:234 (+) Transcript_12562:63-764(+)